MNRRGFIKFLGIGTAAVATSPTVIAKSPVACPVPPKENTNLAPLGWYEKAEYGYDYVIGVYLGSPSVLSVLRKGKGDEPSVQVAEFTCSSDLDILLANCMFLADKYKDCHPYGPMFTIEQVMSPGDTIQSLLKMKGYRRFHKVKRYKTRGKPTKDGWYSTAWSRPMVIERFLTAYKEKWVVIKSTPLLKTLDGAKFRNVNGQTIVTWDDGIADNRFMAAATAYFSAYAMDDFHNTLT